MTLKEFNQLIDHTIEIGQDLIFNEFNDDDFNTYESSIDSIVETGYRMLRNKEQLKACQVISSSKIKDFKLNFIQQIFFSNAKNTNWHVSHKNNKVEIKKRYILDTNSHLCVLKIKN